MTARRACLCPRTCTHQYIYHTFWRDLCFGSISRLCTMRFFFEGSLWALLGTNFQFGISRRFTHTALRGRVSNSCRTGDIPPELGNLRSLQRLFLSENHLTGEATGSRLFASSYPGGSEMPSSGASAFAHFEEPSLSPDLILCSVAQELRVSCSTGSSRRICRL